MTETKGPGRPKVWDSEAQKKEAYRVREKHPNWNNEMIKAFILGVQEATDDKAKEKFERMESIPSNMSDVDILKIPLQDLIDTHRNPTGHVSPLTDVEWINKYLYIDLFHGGSLYDTQVEISKHFDTNLWAAADVWRGVGKTMLSFGKIDRKMCDNPNIKLCLITEETTKAMQRVSVIKQIFKQNPFIIHDYGYLPHDKVYEGYRGKWSSKMLQLKRDIIAQEPTLIALSQGATDMLGYHFDGTLIDDPWSDELQRQKGAKDKWMDWFTVTFLGCMEKGAFCWMLFTRKGPDDLYNDIIYRRGLLKAFRKPAIQKYPSDWSVVKDAKGLPIIDQELGVPKIDIKSNDGIISDACHGRFSMPYLLGKRIQQGKYKFEQEYQCNPIPLEGGLLDWNALKFYGHPTMKLQTYEYPDFAKLGGWTSAMDMAFGLSDKADYTVLVVMATYGGRIYWVDMWRDRVRTEGKIAMLNAAKEKYPRLSTMGIESGYTQTDVVKTIMQRCPNLPIKPIDPRGAGRNYTYGVGSAREYDAKILRVYDQWTPVLVNKNFFINYKLPYFDEFEHEFRFLGNTEHDDIMDATGYCLEMMNKGAFSRFILSGRSGYTNYKIF